MPATGRSRRREKISGVRLPWAMTLSQIAAYATSILAGVLLGVGAAAYVEKEFDLSSTTAGLLGAVLIILLGGVTGLLYVRLRRPGNDLMHQDLPGEPNEEPGWNPDRDPDKAV